MPAGYVGLEREESDRRKKVAYRICLGATAVYGACLVISGYLAVNSGSHQDRLILKLVGSAIFMSGTFYFLIAPYKGSKMEIADMEGKTVLAFDFRGKLKITKGDANPEAPSQPSSLEWRSRPHLALAKNGTPQLEFVALWDSSGRVKAFQIIPGMTKVYFAIMKSPELSDEDVQRVLLAHLDELVPQLRARM